MLVEGTIILLSRLRNEQKLGMKKYVRSVFCLKGRRGDRWSRVWLFTRSGSWYVVVSMDGCSGVWSRDTRPCVSISVPKLFRGSVHGSWVFLNQFVLGTGTQTAEYGSYVRSTITTEPWFFHLVYILLFWSKRAVFAHVEVCTGHDRYTWFSHQVAKWKGVGKHEGLPDQSQSNFVFWKMKRFLSFSMRHDLAQKLSHHRTAAAPHLLNTRRLN